MEEVVTGGTELIRLAEGTKKGAGPRPRRSAFHEDSFPRRSASGFSGRSCAPQGSCSLPRPPNSESPWVTSSPVALIALPLFDNLTFSHPGDIDRK